MPDTETRGFCYVANTSAYLAEALSSLASLRRHMPAARVCAIAPRALWQADTPVDDWREPLLHDRTPIVKNDATLAPYDRVAFIDTDTFFAGDMMDVFDLLDAFDLAAAHEPTRGWDYATPAPPAFCELNTGVLVFRNTPKIRTLFDVWLSEYRRLFIEQNLRNDQPAFRNALWATTDIRVATLPSEYHCITGKPVAIAWEARLLHGRGDLEQMARKINARVGYRAYVDGLGLLFPFAGRRLWLRGWIGLTREWLRVLTTACRPRPREIQGKPHEWHLGETGPTESPAKPASPVPRPHEHS